MGDGLDMGACVCLRCCGFASPLCGLVLCACDVSCLCCVTRFAVFNIYTVTVPYWSRALAVLIYML